MLFYRIEFLILLGALITLFAVVRNNTIQKRILLLASYYFYAYWDWRFCSLIFASTVIDYVAGHLIAESTDARRRRLLLGVSIAANLGILGFFKYYNFFVDSLRNLLEPAGPHGGTLGIILPVGISFYTFQSMS